MSIMTDIYDVAAVGVELTENSVRPFVHGYKDISKFSIGGEYLFENIKTIYNYAKVYIE